MPVVLQMTITSVFRTNAKGIRKHSRIPLSFDDAAQFGLRYLLRGQQCTMARILHAGSFQIVGESKNYDNLKVQSLNTLTESLLNVVPTHGVAINAATDMHMPMADIDLTGPPRGFVDSVHIKFLHNQGKALYVLVKGAFGVVRIYFILSLQSLLIVSEDIITPFYRTIIKLQLKCLMPSIFP